MYQYKALTPSSQLDMEERFKACMVLAGVGDALVIRLDIIWILYDELLYIIYYFIYLFVYILYIFCIYFENYFDILFCYYIILYTFLLLIGLFIIGLQ